MKITIEALPPGGEEEIIIRADQLDERIIALIQALKSPGADSGPERFAGGPDSASGRTACGAGNGTLKFIGSPDTGQSRSLGGSDPGRLTAFREGGGICLVELTEIYYFESVDDKVFAYAENDVAEVKWKLYELEERLAGGDFIRIAKSMILNLSKVKRFAPYMGGRFEALLENGEKVLISRQYVPELKKVLGL